MVENMTQVIKDKTQYRQWIAVVLSASLLSLTGTLPAPASEPGTPSQTLQSKALSTLDLPQELPPLGEAEKYLPVDQLRLVLRLGERRVYLYRGQRVEVSYPVAVGKDGWETPTGTFQVTQKIENPRWQNPWTGEVLPPGPNSALGLRWIGFWTNGKDFIGFHGTPTLNSIGQAASHGCVRMRNEDVVSLFEKVKLGTPVVVEP